MTNRKRLLGKKVICVNDNFSHLSKEQLAGIPNRPVKDKTYVIRDAFKTFNGWAYHLVEISNPHLDHPSGMGTFEPSFNQNRFTDPIEGGGRTLSIRSKVKDKTKEIEKIGELV